MSADRTDHVDDSYGSCVVCREYVPNTEDDMVTVAWPCAVVLLAHAEAKSGDLRARLARAEAVVEAAQYPHRPGDCVIDDCPCTCHPHDTEAGSDE